MEEEEGGCPPPPLSFSLFCALFFLPVIVFFSSFFFPVFFSPFGNPLFFSASPVWGVCASLSLREEGGRNVSPSRQCHFRWKSFSGDCVSAVVWLSLPAPCARLPLFLFLYHVLSPARRDTCQLLSLLNNSLQQKRKHLNALSRVSTTTTKNPKAFLSFRPPSPLNPSLFFPAREASFPPFFLSRTAQSFSFSSSLSPSSCE